MTHHWWFGGYPRIVLRDDPSSAPASLSPAIAVNTASHLRKA